MSQRTALITGITGQDGSYLAEFLLKKGYHVFGLVRQSSVFNTARIEHLTDQFDNSRLEFLRGDLTDGSSLARLLRLIKPDEIYHLAAQSHVMVSFEIPEYTSDAIAVGMIRLVEGVREFGIQPRIYNASSSEMFGNTPAPQDEESALAPRSPYAAAKTFAHQIARIYRQSYRMHICNGILFNHESPRRGERFVTRKISRAVARIKLGLQDDLTLGNLDARRDWGYTPEYVEAMWLMLQQDEPDDYVIATGESHSVLEFVEEAFRYMDLDWHKHVKLNDRYLRPLEVDNLQGNYEKARRKLGWKPRTTFDQLVRIMVDADLERERLLLDGTAAHPHAGAVISY